MAVTLNASTSSGLIQTADTSGVISLQNNGTTGLTLTSGNLQFNSGFGSVATAYGCRAWVNFSGTGTVTIRASGNVTSITDNGTGDYTLNFTTAMPDVNYSTTGTANIGTGNYGLVFNPSYGAVPTTTTFRFSTSSAGSGGILFDCAYINAAVFR